MGVMNPTLNPDTQFVPTNLGFASTTLAAAMANTTAGVTLAVAQLNDALKTAYLNQFSAFAADVMNGHSKAADAPKPPNGYVVGYFTDQTNPNAKWAYPQAGSTPVCDMPPLPTPPAQSGPVGDIPSTNGYRNVPVGDILPVGQILTDPSNGDQWQKQQSASPFGTRTFYALIASSVTPGLVRPKVS